VTKLTTISDLKGTLMDVALSSHYLVNFTGFRGGLETALNSRGISSEDIAKIGLLCYDASLPGSALATTNIEGNFTGVQQQYAHTRQFPNIDMGFYCDSEYKVLMFFETWMEYISGGGSTQAPNNPGYFYRMRYPEGDNGYKIYPTIAKFDRNYTNGIQYNFVRLFPKQVSATPVSYEQSQLLRVNVSFNYERYFATSTTGLSAYKTSSSSNNGSSPDYFGSLDEETRKRLLKLTNFDQSFTLDNIGYPEDLKEVFTNGIPWDKNIFNQSAYNVNFDASIGLGRGVKGDVSNGGTPETQGNQAQSGTTADRPATGTDNIRPERLF
jgi:hypothetical protein